MVLSFYVCICPVQKRIGFSKSSSSLDDHLYLSKNIQISVNIIFVFEVLRPTCAIV